MQLKETRKELEKFGRFVVKEARKNLAKKNVSSKLHNSIKYKPITSNDSIGVIFEMEDYGKFQDEGVRGAKSYYADKNTSGSPYKFKSKGGKRGLKGMPPTSAFDQFVIRKGLKGIRDKQGRFISRKGIKFLIAKSVFEKGIKASMFFTKPFNEAFKKLPPKLQEKFGIDIENIIFE
tara:strand:+ start:25 stop:555 length:531 start_codon:yes stop_codon:yes gene_type:complete